MNKYITEFIGTMFLVLVVGIAAIAGTAGAMAPVAIGTILMVMVYAGGHISGAHYNPAVTLAVLIRGKIDMGGAITYWIAQIGGALAAWAIATFIFDITGADTSAVKSVGQGLTAEILGTLALAYVVLNTATAKGTNGNSFYGLAIGFTVLTCAYSFGAYSGGAFNPAVAIGACLMKGFVWADFWIYLVGGLVGGALAAFIFNMNNPDDK
ncbi:MAG: aquaporin [Ferruginibacter sp.]|nr:aquaporin [Bacteroidota bacterium]MBX2919805.1 aquaporin [Ferruginibacter sp.]MCB0709314.1 aquaporin [Chitinophagaceae bacterium]MCC7379189.1 aquaporin [Chitinophagaceae bacterium]